jgi:hypothetical protein
MHGHAFGSDWFHLFLGFGHWPFGLLIWGLLIVVFAVLIWSLFNKRQ